MSKIHVISPASKSSCRRGAVIDQGSWDSEFLGRATKRDETGFPTEGSFGVSFAVKFDLSKAPQSTLEREAVRAIHARGRQKGITKTEAEAQRNARQLISIFKSLKKGDIIAFKHGTKLIAYVELTSDYRFCEEQAWGWHSWSYRVLKKVAETEQPSNRAGLVPTFRPNYIPLPPGLIAPEVKSYSVPNGAWAWA